jgi:hypothetical protein
MGGGQAQETLSRRSQELELLWGSMDKSMISPGKLSIDVISFWRVGYVLSSFLTCWAEELMALNSQKI